MGESCQSRAAPILGGRLALVLTAVDLSGPQLPPALGGRSAVEHDRDPGQFVRSGATAMDPVLGQQFGVEVFGVFAQPQVHLPAWPQRPGRD